MKQKGCGCNSKGRSPTIVAAPRQGAADWSESMSRLRLSRGLMLEVGDSDLTMVEFNPPDIGDKTRYGLHDFGNGNVIVYGRFNKGDQFYVHYKDIEADRNIARGQGREPMFIITGPAREEIEVEHEVEPLKPPEEISEVEWLKPDKPVAPVLPPHDGTDVVLPDLTPKSMVSEPIFFAEAETIDQKPIDADNYFPEPTTALGRRTDIVDLELADLKSPDRYVAILKGSNIHTAWDIVKYEEKYSEKGISRLDGIGPKVRKAFVDAARKVI